MAAPVDDAMANHHPASPLLYATKLKGPGQMLSAEACGAGSLPTNPPTLFLLV